MRPVNLSCLLVLLLTTTIASFARAQPAPSGGSDAATVEYARGFTVDSHAGYTLVSVTRPWPGSRQEFRYLLVQRGRPVPGGYPGVPVIRVPIRSIVALSSTYLAEIAELGELDTIRGVESLSYVYSPEIRSRIKSGKIETVGEGQSLNIEALIALKPDVVMTTAFGGSADLYPRLEAAGLPVVINGDWAELTPLGRAEWLKFIALFYDKGSKAAELFNHVASEYHRLAALAANSGRRPTVFVNAPWQGTWDVPGGRSYMARLLHDAGADYLWQRSESTGTLSLDFEAVFDRAANADFWINPGAWRSLAEAKSVDPRFALFKAFKEHHLYNSIARTTPDGGNDYWESGPANPQIVLRDLIRIFHPDLLPGRKLYYFKRLE